MDSNASGPSYKIIGPETPVSPVILSVPHAGRDYPLEIRSMLRVPVSALRPLEDRYVDAVALGARADESLIMAMRPRAWIDLNRAEEDRDPAVEQRGSPFASAKPSLKVKSGLGLIPRRAGDMRHIWKRRFDTDEVEMRVKLDHRPYHEKLSDLLQCARNRFGSALLLDIHSMPPVSGQDRPPEIVIGDRFGQSASGHMIDCIRSEAEAAGYRVAINSPYAGGYILERHAAPQHGIQAVQLEIDRKLYLDFALNEPAPGLNRVIKMVRKMVQSVRSELSPDFAVAAE